LQKEVELTFDTNSELFFFVYESQDRLQDELGLVDLDLIVEIRNNELLTKENKELAKKISRLTFVLSSLTQKPIDNTSGEVAATEDATIAQTPVLIQILSPIQEEQPTSTTTIGDDSAIITTLATDAPTLTTPEAPSTISTPEFIPKPLPNQFKQSREYILSLDNTTKLGRPLSQRFEEVVIVMEEPVSAEEQSLDSEFWHSSDEGDDKDWSDINNDDDDDDETEGESEDSGEGEP